MTHADSIGEGYVSYVAAEIPYLLAYEMICIRYPDEMGKILFTDTPASITRSNHGMYVRKTTSRM